MFVEDVDLEAMPTSISLNDNNDNVFWLFGPSPSSHVTLCLQNRHVVFASYCHVTAIIMFVRSMHCLSAISSLL